jgi:hypothetical protein
MNDALFPLPPATARPMEAAPAEARLLRPNRQQLVFRPRSHVNDAGAARPS